MGTEAPSALGREEVIPGRPTWPTPDEAPLNSTCTIKSHVAYPVGMSKFKHLGSQSHIFDFLWWFD